MVEGNQQLFDLVSPHALAGASESPKSARQKIHLSLWLEAVAIVLRLFPGNGNLSYCKNFGDVPPLALETVFDKPLHDLESLLLRLRSVLVPTLAAHEEIARIVAQELAAAE